MNRVVSRPPTVMEEAFVEVIQDALAGSDLLIVDDLNRVREVCDNCNNPRSGLFDGALATILDSAYRGGKQLLFATDHPTVALANQAHTWDIDDLEAAD